MKKRILNLGIVLILLLALAPTVKAFDMTKVGKPNTISSSSGHTAFVDADGVLWTWGGNYHGVLGDGTTESRDTPVKVMDNVISVSCDSLFTSVIKSDNSLWVWGDNWKGQLGNGTQTGSYTPVKLMENVIATSIGGDALFIVKEDNTLWLCGFYPGNMLDAFTTVPVKIMDDVVAVSAGAHHVAAIKGDNSLWMWGVGGAGELGTGNGRSHTTPVQVLDDVVAVSCGDALTAAVKSDGSLWTWGRNNYGQLGNGTSDDKTTHDTPVKVMDDVEAVSAGFHHLAIIKTDHTLWMCGFNDWGQLGDGTQVNRSTPVKVMDNVTSVCTGYTRTFATKSDGSIWGWGYNEDNLVGNGGISNVTFLPEHSSSTRSCQTIPYQLTLSGDSIPPVVPNNLMVSPSSCAATLDGKPITLNAYLFSEGNGGTNYVMLRDVAYILNGTKAQFEVGWSAANGIALTKGRVYTPVGGEMQSKGTEAKSYTSTTNAIIIDGEPFRVDAYTIEGNNYVKLRDLGALLGFTVDWDNATGTILIGTSK